MATKTWVPSAFTRLVERRYKALGLTQAELGKMLGYTDSYMSQILKGRMPSMKAPDFLDRWSKALEIDKETLIAEGQLQNYNLVPPAEGDLSPGRRLLLAVTAHLPDETVERIARGVREQFGVPDPGPGQPKGQGV